MTCHQHNWSKKTQDGLLSRFCHDCNEFEIEIEVAKLRAERDAARAEVERLRTADVHSCGPTCSRAGCVQAREDAHALIVKHGTHSGAVYETLYAVQHGDLDLEEASRVIDAICAARVPRMAAEQALIVRAMRDGRSTIHWRADESAATALIRERDQLAAKVEELHARLRQSSERTAKMLLGELVRAIDSGEDTASPLWIARDYLGRKQPDDRA